MRAFVLGVSFQGGLMPQAMAQLACGPTAVKTEVNGVPITVNMTSGVTIDAVGDKPMVDARIPADLIDSAEAFR